MTCTSALKASQRFSSSCDCLQPVWSHPHGLHFRSLVSVAEARKARPRGDEGGVAAKKSATRRERETHSSEGQGLAPAEPLKEGDTAVPVQALAPVCQRGQGRNSNTERLEPGVSWHAVATQDPTRARRREQSSR